MIPLILCRNKQHTQDTVRMIKHSANDNRNQRESTETEQKQEKKEESPYRDGESEPNEILRHIPYRVARMDVAILHL